MRRTFLLLLSLAVGWIPACRDAHVADENRATATVPAASSAETGVASKHDAGEDAGVERPVAAMRDRELGALIDELSEPTGEFPSDNFVSNETSYLHVAPVLSDPKLQGKAYVGVGPEQNLTYVALMQPRMAYIVDIRRQNMLEHLVLRALIETSEHRAKFLARLTGRELSRNELASPERSSIDEIADALERVQPSKDRVEREVQEALALQERLGVRRMPRDEEGMRSILRAFERQGLGLSYTMENSGRRYPKVRALLAMTGPDGEQQSFVADEERYQRVREMLRANRIVPVVGDFGGKVALQGVAGDMRKRGLVLGVFYTSNVEQYLFEGGVYGQFIRNVRAFPIDEGSLILRVWFDQGRAHPRQQQGHRTTSLATGAGAFLSAWEKKPYRSYWDVVTRE